MITLRALSKRYGEITAVRDLTLEVVPGRVTGFLGPNGAGKSTTMRMVLGLDAPTEGETLIDGQRYATLRYPRRDVEALPDARRCTRAAVPATTWWRWREATDSVGHDQTPAKAVS